MKSDTDSGWRWGPFNIIDRPEFGGRRPLTIEQKGGCVHYPYEVTPEHKHSQHISQVDQKLPIIHKGNHFSHFTHGRDYDPEAKWYFWDNCLIPQLMTQSEANPLGGKNWARVIYRATMPGDLWPTEQRLEWHSDRVNRTLHRISQGQIRDWQQLCPITHRETEGDSVLLILPSEQAIQHWYGWTNQQLIQRVQQVCDQHGWQLVIRPKPTRQARNQGQTIQNQLRSRVFRSAVTVNSTAGLEVVCEGVPCVALGTHPLAYLNTPWQDFERGWFCPPTPEFVKLRLQQLICLTWHKTELLDGTWALSPETDQAKPNQTWSIDI